MRGDLLEAEVVTADPDISEFHKTLYQILCSREPASKRIKAAETAIAAYAAALQNSLTAGTEAPTGYSAAAMVDRHLANIETQLKTWRELFRVGTDMGPVCDAALRAVGAERHKRAT
jgi:hypothetical protein